MEALTPEGRTKVEEVAQRHAVSTDAVLVLLRALDRGGGMQAQFSHPDLGGMGQWSRGGMIMVGDMFNSGLKARVDALCNELSDALRDHRLFAQHARSEGGRAWWPEDCGTPSSSGSQNDMSYACFPDKRRLAIQTSGVVRVYDTGDHRIGGVSQQQSGGQDLTFTSQYGTVRLHELAIVGDAPPMSDARLAPDAMPLVPPLHEASRAIYEVPPPFHEASHAASAAPRAVSQAQRHGSPPEDDIFGKIERLHALQKKGVLSEAEFAEKKKELLARI